MHFFTASNTHKAKTNGPHIKTDVIRGVEKVDAFNEEYGGSMLIFRYYAPFYFVLTR
jgi:hypothetical protein